MPDAHKNFAYSTIATAPSPATTGTSLVVASGDGTKFPAASFNAVVWPANQQPSLTNAEIVRVTAKATDTFTITRDQESSTNRSIQVGDQIHAGPTKKWFDDIEGDISTHTAASNPHSGSQPLDSDLTTIAGLTATTDNFIVSVSSAWASRTPAQVRTTLGLVIGTDVQAYDADLTTWGGKTAPSGTVVGTSDTQTLTNKRVDKRVVTLTDAATIAVNCDTTDVGVVIMSGDRTLGVPSGTPIDGQQLVIRVGAATTPRTLTLTTGSSGSYAFGTDITALSATTNSKYDYLGFMYNSGSDRWHILAYVKGY